jgi:hypothetical protein
MFVKGLTSVAGVVGWGLCPFASHTHPLWTSLLSSKRQMLTLKNVFTNG